MVNYNVALEGKTILVTGAAGFIGSNLVKRIFSEVENVKVIGIDNMNDYYDVNIKRERLQQISALNSNFVFVIGMSPAFAGCAVYKWCPQQNGSVWNLYV